MVKDYPINSIKVARLRDENYALEKRNADLVAALQNLFDWYDYDPNCIDNCPACIAYADAKEILDQVGKEE